MDKQGVSTVRQIRFRFTVQISVERWVLSFRNRSDVIIAYNTYYLVNIMLNIVFETASFLFFIFLNHGEKQNHIGW